MYNIYVKWMRLVVPHDRKSRVSNHYLLPDQIIVLYCVADERMWASKLINSIFFYLFIRGTTVKYRIFMLILYLTINNRSERGWLDDLVLHKQPDSGARIKYHTGWIECFVLKLRAQQGSGMLGFCMSEYIICIMWMARTQSIQLLRRNKLRNKSVIDRQSDTVVSCHVL